MNCEDELKTPDNIEARMRNIFEAVVELHLSICYTVSFEYIYWFTNITDFTNITFNICSQFLF